MPGFSFSLLKRVFDEPSDTVDCRAYLLNLIFFTGNSHKYLFPKVSDGLEVEDNGL
jgi:hypothetical protein